MSLQFEKTKTDDVAFRPYERTQISKYAELAEGITKMKPGETISVPVPKGKDPAKTRTSMAASVRTQLVRLLWEYETINDGLGGNLRVRLDESSKNVCFSLIAIE